MKTIKAWAFMAEDSKNGKYFVTNNSEQTIIYLKKPRNIVNPFDYSKKPKLNWKPTEIIIKI